MTGGEREWFDWQGAYVAADPLGRVLVELRGYPLGLVLSEADARVLEAQLHIERLAALGKPKVGTA